PQDHGKRGQRDDRVQQVQTDRKNSGVDELPHVFSDALVGIVGGIAEQLHAVVVGTRQPTIEIGLRKPAPPANLQPLIEIELVDREQDKGGGKDTEIAELIDERVPILVLQRVVERVVPRVQQDVQSNDRKLDRDYRGEQNASGPAVFGIEIPAGNSPHDGERRKHASHGRSPVGQKTDVLADTIYWLGAVLEINLSRIPAQKGLIKGAPLGKRNARFRRPLFHPVAPPRTIT